jgi:hypothetical protein
MMHAKFVMPKLSSPTVYIREIDVASLPAQLRAQVEGMETIYSLNAEDGAQIALVITRELAFSVAREHDLAPVMVH